MTEKSIFNKVLIIAAVVVLVLGLLATVYVARLSFAQRVVYQKSDPAYFVLTPGVLAHVEKLCTTQAKFTYSSADGPKPTITAMTCYMKHNKLIEFLSDEGFHEVEPNMFQNDKIQINIKRNGTDLVTEVMVFTYL